eukprot:8808247-Pyramimonas_sp.AAC.1
MKEYPAKLESAPRAMVAYYYEVLTTNFSPVKSQLPLPEQQAEVDALILKASKQITCVSQLEEHSNKVDDSGGESGKELLLRVKASVKEVLQDAVNSNGTLDESCTSLVRFCDILEERGAMVVTRVVLTRPRRSDTFGLYGHFRTLYGHFRTLYDARALRSRDKRNAT